MTLGDFFLLDENRVKEEFLTKAKSVDSLFGMLELTLIELTQTMSITIYFFQETIKKETIKTQRGKRKSALKDESEKLLEVEPSQDKKSSRKRAGAGSQAQQEPPKKVTKRKKKQVSSLSNPDLSEQSVSELKSDIVMDSQYVTRGRMKKILTMGDNSIGRLKSSLTKGDKHVKSPAARTKTRARLSSSKGKSTPAAAKSRRNKSKSR